MKLPLQITFRNLESSEMAEDWIREEVFKLEEFYNRIMACRVTVEIPHRHHRRGTRYHVSIDLTMPGGELVIKREPSLSKRLRLLGETVLAKNLEVDTPHKNLRLAIHDAFKVAGRRLQDYARRQGGYVKNHEPLPEGRVSRLFPEKGYGFLVTPDAREIYFHQDSVLNQGFRRMEIGTRVVFSEEPGEKGPQASTVRIAAKHAIRAAEEPADVSAD
ncbi:MAG TPA: HPF/RaiA family ribosome-associated protein [Candidatus Limnocylindrales bacterium]|nr:HPF/RaiA family ribosome-associated protein [Candidatus Limnocylindrales bacterium]